MRTDGFLSRISALSAADAEAFDKARGGLPLGETDEGELVVAHREIAPDRYHHTCVTGGMKTEFISRLILTLACLYEKTEAAFLIISPDLSIVQEAVINTIPKKNKCKKTKWLSEEALQIAEKRREVKGKGEKER